LHGQVALVCGLIIQAQRNEQVDDPIWDKALTSERPDFFGFSAGGEPDMGEYLALDPLPGGRNSNCGFSPTRDWSGGQKNVSTVLIQVANPARADAQRGSWLHFGCWIARHRP
jgi:hypothetical protein